MTFTQIRIIKWMLLALFLVCTGYVVHHLREGMRSPTVDALDIPDEPENITSRQVELEQLDSEGNTAWTLTAAESVGQTESGQQFRDAEIHFNAGADDTPVVVTADLCNVRRDSSVHLQGNVVVRDNTSLRLEAESLEFRRFPDRVWSSEPVRYFKERHRRRRGQHELCHQTGRARPRRRGGYDPQPELRRSHTHHEQVGLHEQNPPPGAICRHGFRAAEKQVFDLQRPTGFLERRP